MTLTPVVAIRQLCLVNFEQVYRIIMRLSDTRVQRQSGNERAAALRRDWFTRYRLSFFLLLWLVLATAATADESVTLETFFYHDLSGAMTLEHIERLPLDRWQRPHNDTIGYRLSDPEYWSASQGSVLWLKLDIPESSRLDRVWLELLPNTGIDGKIAFLRQGEWQWYSPVNRAAESAILQPARYLTFILNTAIPNKTAYVRLTGEQVFQFSIKATLVDGLLWYFLKSNLFFGMVLGMLFLAMSYNLAIGLRARESMYLTYAFYVCCNLVYLLVTGGYFRLLGPEWGGSALLSNTMTTLVVIAGCIFIREFLETRRIMPGVDKIILGIIVFLALAMLSYSFIPNSLSYLLTISTGVIGPAIAIVVGVIALRQAHPMAIYFAIAWSLYLVSAGFWGWMWLGYVEPKEWVVWLYYLGTLTEVVLLSVVLGFRFSHLKQQTETLGAEKSRYKKLSFTDELTGIFNRRGFVESVEEQLTASESGSLIWLALDVDHFKKFNDQHGHPAGDALLRKMGSMLVKSKRKNDIAGRIGGEEFALLLVDCDLPNAEKFTTRLLKHFAEMKVTAPDGKPVGTTLSIGATAVVSGESMEQVWKRADYLLYEAKSKGRNRVQIG